MDKLTNFWHPKHFYLTSLKVRPIWRANDPPLVVSVLLQPNCLMMHQGVCLGEFLGPTLICGKTLHRWMECGNHIFGDVPIPFVPIFGVVWIQDTLNPIKSHTIRYNPRIPSNPTKFCGISQWTYHYLSHNRLQSRSRELQKLVYSPRRCSKRS